MTTGNTWLRRIAKRLLAPVRKTPIYSQIQAWSMARDITSGRFTEPEIKLLTDAVKPGDTALDIGANFGLYSYHLSRLTGPEGKVIAFEPIPFTSATLKRVIRKLNLRNVEIHAVGVGEIQGTLTFNVPLQQSGQLMAGQAFFSLRNDNHGNIQEQVRWEKTTQIHCPVVVIDEELKNLNSLAFIKIDIEGAEVFAFRGARGLIEKFHPTILIEINPWFLDGFNLRMEDLTGPFRALGYKIYHFDSSRNKLDHVADESTIIESNYLFIHPDYNNRFQTYF
jgi:FkbM family methyltransferase